MVHTDCELHDPCIEKGTTNSSQVLLGQVLLGQVLLGQVLLGQVLLSQVLQLHLSLLRVRVSWAMPCFNTRDAL